LSLRFLKTWLLFFVFVQIFVCKISCLVGLHNELVVFFGKTAFLFPHKTLLINIFAANKQLSTKQ